MFKLIYYFYFNIYDIIILKDAYHQGTLVTDRASKQKGRNPIECLRNLPFQVQGHRLSF